MPAEPSYTSDSHLLLAADDAAGRLRHATPWVSAALARGERVLLASTRDQHELVELVDPAGVHRQAGQLVVLDSLPSPAETDGTAALLALLTRVCETSQEEEWTRLAAVVDPGDLIPGLSAGEHLDLCRGLQRLCTERGARVLCLLPDKAPEDLLHQLAHQHHGVLREGRATPVPGVRDGGAEDARPPTGRPDRQGVVGSAQRDLASTLDGVLRELAASDASLEGVLRVFADVTVEVLATVEAASITVVEPSGLHTAASTAPWVDQLDQVQYRHGRGPCLEVAEHNTPVRGATGAALARQWPEFGSRCAVLGIRGVHAFGLSAAQPGDRSQAHGALNLYARSAEQLSDDEHDLAVLLASFAGAALQSARGRARARNLMRALESRDVIGQAKGILMERYRMDEAAAFAVIRRASNTLQRKVSDVAQHVVDQRELPQSADDAWSGAAVEQAKDRGTARRQ